MSIFARIPKEKFMSEKRRGRRQRGNSMPIGFMFLGGYNVTICEAKTKKFMGAFQEK